MYVRGITLRIHRCVWHTEQETEGIRCIWRHNVKCNNITNEYNSEMPAVCLSVHEVQSSELQCPWALFIVRHYKSRNNGSKFVSVLRRRGKTPNVGGPLERPGEGISERLN
jgi:hypothetical protein